MPKKIPVGYDTIRKAVLLNNSTCMICKLARATEVHHIIPREYGGSDCPLNLLPLCKDCHRELHNRLRPLIKTKIQEAVEQIMREQIGLELNEKEVTWPRWIEIEKGYWKGSPKPGDIGYAWNSWYYCEDLPLVPRRAPGRRRL